MLFRSPEGVSLHNLTNSRRTSFSLSACLAACLENATRSAVNSGCALANCRALAAILARLSAADASANETSKEVSRGRHPSRFIAWMISGRVKPCHSGLGAGATCNPGGYGTFGFSRTMLLGRATLAPLAVKPAVERRAELHEAHLEGGLHKGWYAAVAAANASTDA